MRGRLTTAVDGAGRPARIVDLLFHLPGGAVTRELKGSIAEAPTGEPVTLAVQVLGKLRGQIEVPVDATEQTIVAAALREATEESGIEGLAITSEPAALHVHPVTCSLGVPTRHLDVQFVVRAPEGAQIVRSDESLELRWWSLDRLPDDVDFGLAQLAAAARRLA